MVQPAVGSGSLSTLGRDTAMLLSDLTQGASNWIQSFLDPMLSSAGVARSMSRSHSSETRRTSTRTSTENTVDYPQGFEPLRSECLAVVHPTSSPVFTNPFVSPLLAPNHLLRGLPPVYIVVRDGRGSPEGSPEGGLITQLDFILCFKG